MENINKKIKSWNRCYEEEYIPEYKELSFSSFYFKLAPIAVYKIYPKLKVQSFNHD